MGAAAGLFIFRNLRLPAPVLAARVCPLSAPRTFEAPRDRLTVGAAQASRAGNSAFMLSTNHESRNTNHGLFSRASADRW